jgi:hypothetical protein
MKGLVGFINANGPRMANGKHQTAIDGGLHHLTSLFGPFSRLILEPSTSQ